MLDLKFVNLRKDIYYVKKVNKKNISSNFNFIQYFIIKKIFKIRKYLKLTSKVIHLKQEYSSSLYQIFYLLLEFEAWRVKYFFDF